MIHLYPAPYQVERATTKHCKPTYRWVNAYLQVTHNGHLAPAQTRNEWYHQAQRDEQSLKFHETEQQARQAIINSYPLLTCEDTSND